MEFFKKRIFNSWPSSVVFVAMAFNAILAFLSSFVVYENFSENLFLCYFVVAMAGIGSFAGIVPFSIGEIGRRKLMLALFVQAVSLIFVYAGIYRGYGLKGVAETSWDVGLYFSIVTWTTLGYGDYQPARGIELIAASQAAVGYLFLGLIVAILANLIDGHNPSRKARR